MSKDILEEIIAHKRIEIAGQEKVVSAAFLEKQLGEPVPARSLAVRLRRAGFIRTPMPAKYLPHTSRQEPPHSPS